MARSRRRDIYEVVKERKEGRRGGRSAEMRMKRRGRDGGDVEDNKVRGGIIKRVSTQ